MIKQQIGSVAAAAFFVRWEEASEFFVGELCDVLVIKEEPLVSLTNHATIMTTVSIIASMKHNRIKAIENRRDRLLEGGRRVRRKSK